MIGIFDSGLGGLTVYRYVRSLAPGARIVYLADQRHVPYGERSASELEQLLRANVGYLDRLGVSAIAAGCNTSCAIAAGCGWPLAAAPIFDIIEAGAAAAAASGAQRVGVMATSATVRTAAYARAIARLAPSVDVQEVAAPELVPLIEAGAAGHSALRQAVQRALNSFTGPLDALVYGCTHYPLADATFAALLGSQVVRIDPAFAQAQRVVAACEPAHLAMPDASFRTTGDVPTFRKQLLALGIAQSDVGYAEMSEPLAAQTI